MIIYLAPALAVMLIAVAFAIGHARARRRWRAIIDRYADREIKTQSRNVP
jgi:hypothetical protein